MGACSPSGATTCAPSPACSRRHPRACVAASTTSACAPNDPGSAGPPPLMLGVYLHVPFCRRRCDYCAFATWTDRHHLQQAYVDACRRELAGADLPPATSVFVGGGTPSQLPGPLLGALLDAVARRPGAEVTVECNPEDATPALF